jgi:hypothetical protein
MPMPFFHSHPRLVQLHTKLRQHFLDINDATIGEDMKRWSLKHGVDSNTKWPQFEVTSGKTGDLT